MNHRIKSARDFKEENAIFKGDIAELKRLQKRKLIKRGRR
jgi:hypothetical protein